MKKRVYGKSNLRLRTIIFHNIGITFCIIMWVFCMFKAAILNSGKYGILTLIFFILLFVTFYLGREASFYETSNSDILIRKEGR